MPSCRSCGARVLWVTVTPGRRAMPLDPDPTPEGNIIVDWRNAMAVVLSVEGLAVVREETPSEPLYRSHFATCPDADDWRRP